MAPIEFLREILPFLPEPEEPLVARRIVKAGVAKMVSELHLQLANKGLTDLEARRLLGKFEPCLKEGKSVLNRLLEMEGNGKYLSLGVLSFAPWLVPLAEVGNSLDLPNLAEKLGIHLSPSSILEGMRAYSDRAKQRREEFEKKLEGAIQNPTLEDLGKGDLFVLDEEGLNNLLQELMNKGGKQKVRNFKVAIDDYRLKISGEYDTFAGWIDFTAVAEFELKNGKADGSIKKIAASGFDLTGIVEEDILQAFRKFELDPPGNAKIKDLSWVQLPGIKRIEIDRGRVILEREPAPTGPT